MINKTDLGIHHFKCIQQNEVNSVKANFCTLYKCTKYVIECAYKFKKKGEKGLH